MNIFFDMDYTILGVDGTDLRPGVKEVFERLRVEGHTIYIWSGVGVRKKEVEQLGLTELVNGVFEKPTDRYEESVRKMLEVQELPVPPDLVVDDYPEIVTALGGILVRPYFFKDSHDHEMERVYQVIHQYASDGHASDVALRPKRSQG